MPENEEIEELKKELRKLNPQDKIKKLKDLQEKRKAEIIGIDGLIKDSEKELRAETVAEEISPQQLEVNIRRIFEEEPANLERAVKKEAPQKSTGEGLGYISLTQAHSYYSALQDIAYASMEGHLTASHLDAIDQIGERLEKIKYHTASQDAVNLLVASRATLYKIRKYAGLE